MGISFLQWGFSSSSEFSRLAKPKSVGEEWWEYHSNYKTSYLLVVDVCYIDYNSGSFNLS